MTKQQQKQIGFIKAHICNGNIDSAARGMSALIRSATNNKQSSELQQIACELKLTNHASFIIQ